MNHAGIFPDPGDLKIRGVIMINSEAYDKLQDERKKLQAEYESLPRGKQLDNRSIYSMRLQFLEFALKILNSQKAEKIEELIEELQERLAILENPQLKAVK